eukprot:Selendium_serpulae@DN6197_c0_g1_i1.p1
MACPLDVREGVSWGIEAVADRIEVEKDTPLSPRLMMDDADIALLQTNASDLDTEGRCIFTDHGTFCLFNTYFPAVRVNSDGTVDEDRLNFKMLFNRAFQCCVYEAHIRQGRDVLLVGDFNISAIPIEEEHTPMPSKKWLVEMMNKYHLVDLFRNRHPGRKDAFTCWSQEKGGRMTNYGSRVDYIIASQNLNLDLIGDCDILPDFMGSDHCPIVANLPKRVYGDESQNAHPMCARFLSQAKMRQTSLLSFCEPRTSQKIATLENKVADGVVDINSNVQANTCETDASCTVVINTNVASESRKRMVTHNMGSSKRHKGVQNETVTNSVEDVWRTVDSFGFGTAQHGPKRLPKPNERRKVGMSKASDAGPRQQSLHAFARFKQTSPTDTPTPPSPKRLTPPNTFGSQSPELVSPFETTLTPPSPIFNAGILPSSDGQGREKDVACDFIIVDDSPENKDGGSSGGCTEGPTQAHRQEDGEPSTARHEADAETETSHKKNDVPKKGVCSLLSYKANKNRFEDSVISDAISFLSEKEQKQYRDKMDLAPLCPGHRIPCVERVVKKEGPNKGRKFWSCVKPAGRPKDPAARCNCFIWSDAMTRATMKKNTT